MSGPCLRHAARSGGFTLSEMIAVLVVVAIIGAIALPRMANDPVLVSTQADQLAGDIRYVQTLAMTKGQRYIISFPSATSYRILDSAGSPVPHPSNGSSAAITLAAGVTLALATSPAGNALGFDGLGVPYSVTAPSTFNGELTVQATITLSGGGGANRQVVITPQTGKTTP